MCFDHLLLVPPRGDDVISRAHASVQCGVSRYLHLHRLFEQYFYIIIPELFSSGSVLCVCLQTIIFKEFYYLNRLSGSINK